MALVTDNKIAELKKYLEENGIDIPRVCGFRLMKNEELVSEKDMREYAGDFVSYIILPGTGDLTEKRYKMALKRIKKQYNMFNKYVGKNVLCVHAQLGGGFWDAFEMNKLVKHPLYLERVDDYFNTTCCDIYFKQRGIDKL